MRLLPHPSVLPIPLSFHFAVLPWSSLCCPSSPLSSLLLSRCSSLLCSVLPGPSSHPCPPPPSSLCSHLLPQPLVSGSFPTFFLQFSGSRGWQNRVLDSSPGDPAAATPSRMVPSSRQPSRSSVLHYLQPPDGPGRANSSTPLPAHFGGHIKSCRFQLPSPLKTGLNYLCCGCLLRLPSSL